MRQLLVEFGKMKNIINTNTFEVALKQKLESFRSLIHNPHSCFHKESILVPYSIITISPWIFYFSNIFFFHNIAFPRKYLLVLIRFFLFLTEFTALDKQFARNTTAATSIHCTANSTSLRRSCFSNTSSIARR